MSIRSLISQPFLRRDKEWYQHFFSIDEIARNSTVQWLTGAMFLYFLITFAQWSYTNVVSRGADTTCWPYFPSCHEWYFFTSLPNGYSQNIFYMALFGIMALGAYCMWKKRWTLAHACLLTLFTWKMFAGFALSYELLGVYDYYHLILTAIILFIPQKEYFSKAAFVLLYFLSATIKFYPTWVLGTYFTSLQTGLALFPDSLTLIITNSVILAQVVGCWFLMSDNRRWQYVAFIYFEIFHFYSGIYVGYFYPLIAIPTLTILFGPLYRYQRPPLTKRSVAGWIFLTLLTATQLYTFAIPGDQKMTLEGYRYGVWMFDANHQCVATITEHYPITMEGLTVGTWEAASGSSCFGLSCLTKKTVQKTSDEWTVTEQRESPKSWSRCSPYLILAKYKKACLKATHIAFQFDHSINGGPFYRIVDTSNLCALSYASFWHNEWITEAPEAEVIGYPVKNTYSGFTE